ncbi:MAG TPA: (5-formylfuran-3-yl)methyl phosphate synthase [Planctomycetaceae bacterium]|nr:(5-formylfuran-3-yl)methyl phosphate synthase [Planctomycetaceae bacterium]HQZ69313.1 (5-formylfuran-3-yl)methyl phosphate synthase [Planctomycetaceae bacterium]
MPQLLVSVRNAVEAIAAVEGGADIIDVKEPNRGSLGCAAPDVIREIGAAVRNCLSSLRPLSLALGELTEWESCTPVASAVATTQSWIQSSPDCRSEHELELRAACHHAAPQFLKIGLANVVSAYPDQSWMAHWNDVRGSIGGQHVWVAVGYADYERAVAPSVDEVLAAAVETGCGVLLIDTHQKDSSSLLDWLTLNQLHSLRRDTLRHGIKLAIAGRITLTHLPNVLAVKADIVAVRGAVCERGSRTASVSKNLVKQFRAALLDG